MKIDKLVLLAIVIIAIIFVGEVTAYGPNVHNYKANAELNGDSLEISITTSGSDVYSAIVLDNGSHPAMTQLYIYMDERYDKFFGEAWDIVMMKKIDMKYSIDQVCRSLNVRGFYNISILNDEQLRDAMSGDLAGRVSKGLLIMSYALPENIYSGSADDLLFKWTERGGYVYCMSSPFGMFYHSESGLATVDNSQMLFFGKTCMNLEPDDDTPRYGIAHTVIEGKGLTEALSLKWNRVTYALNVSCVDGAFAMGFSEHGYSSVSMVPFGDGMICILGGVYHRQQVDDIAQIIASGVTCYSEVLEIKSGSFTRETVKLSVDIPDGKDNVSVYVSIGGYYLTYGRLIQCSTT